MLFAINGASETVAVSQVSQELELSNAADLDLLRQNTQPGAAWYCCSLCVCLSIYLTQELFGRDGFEYRMFQMFQSSTRDLLFSDDTACLANLQDKTTYRKYLGPEYLKAIANMGQCLHSGE